jgi:hypothetical protein
MLVLGDIPLRSPGKFVKPSYDEYVLLVRIRFIE